MGKCEEERWGGVGKWGEGGGGLERYREVCWGVGKGVVHSSPFPNTSHLPLHFFTLPRV